MLWSCVDLCFVYGSLQVLFQLVRAGLGGTTDQGEKQYGIENKGESFHENPPLAVYAWYIFIIPPEILTKGNPYDNTYGNI
jgi:hypothetical protein